MDRRVFRHRDNATTIQNEQSAPTRRARHSQAFSLLEVLVAGALFLTTLSGVLTAIGTMSGVEEHQRRMTVATALGEQSMEELLLRWSGHPDIDVGNTRSRFYTSKAVPSTSSTPDGYEVSWTISRVDKIQNLKNIVLQVIWTESTGEKDITYFTYRP